MARRGPGASAAGSPQGAVAMPLVLLLVLAASAASGVHARGLQQTDALSNSNGCLATIPKCEPGACASRNVMGVARWVCLRCLANYAPVVDASGQDNIVQCVCPRGFFEASDSATSCSRCAANNYCPGGDMVENPASRGSNVTCGNGLVTRNTGARSQADCVAPAGFAMTSPTVATPCARSEYAPMYNRLAKCLKCQSGLEEPLASGLTASQHNSKRAVCKLPPGKYMSQGLVRICPQGFYRENYVAFDAAVGTLCLPCNPGITTSGAGAKLASECNRVLPGHGIAQVLNVTGPASIPALPQNASGLPNATVCDIGFYSTGGYCAECPSGTVTRVKGAQSIEECAVPPGYVLQSGAMGQCPSGTFREGWVMYSDPKATLCTPCGENIASEPKDLDENPKALAGALARASSSCCFIEAGQGMIAQGRNLFVAKDCPINTYGAAGKVYGWAAAPCKPCPRNMITDGATKVNNSNVCVNDDGFGYASEGASRCAPGFYSAKGSRKPCQQCATGRTTDDAPLKQRFITDCFVKPGHGVVDSTGNSTDGSGFLSDTSGLSNATAVALPVLECPIGFYGRGNALGATCQQCPEGSTTEDSGKTSIADCNVCIAGYGQLALSTGNTTSCTLCDYGAYHGGGGTACTACPAATFYPPVDGVGDTWTSRGITLFTGAKGVEFCVPRESQLSPDAGQAYFNAAVETELLTVVPRADLAACIATCPPESGCMVQFHTGGLCKYAALPWDASGTTGTKLLYKLPPSTLGAASSLKPAKQAVRAKMIASGFFARLAITEGAVASWLKVGVPLDAGRAQTFRLGAAPEWDANTDEATCRRKCEDSVVCWGLLYDADSRACLYRGGEDALGTRAFFVMPNVGGVPQAPPSGAASSPALATPSPSPSALAPSPSPVLEPSPALALAPSSSPASFANGDLPIDAASEASPSPVLAPSPALTPSPSPLLAPSPVLAPSPSPVLAPSPALAPSPSPALAASPSPALAAPPSPALAPSPSPALAPSPSPALAPSPSPALAPPIAGGSQSSPSPRPPSPSPVPSSPSPRLASPSPRAASPSPRLVSPSPMPPSPSPPLVTPVIPRDVEDKLCTADSQRTPNDCVASCSSDRCCLARFDDAAGMCKRAELDWDDTDSTKPDGHRLCFKYASQSTSGSHYARGRVPDDTRTAWLQVGRHLDRDSASVEVEAEDFDGCGDDYARCQEKCDASVSCKFFIYHFDKQACTYHSTGGDADTYFVAPLKLDAPVVVSSEPPAAKPATAFTTVDKADKEGNTFTCLTTAQILAAMPQAQFQCSEAHDCAGAAQVYFTPGTSSGSARASGAGAGHYCACSNQLLLTLPCPKAGVYRFTFASTLTLGDPTLSPGVYDNVWASKEGSFEEAVANARLSCRDDLKDCAANAATMPQPSYGAVKAEVACSAGQVIALHEEYSMLCMGALEWKPKN